MLWRDRVIIDGVWSGDWIYRPLITQLVTTSNYNSLNGLHILKITVTEAHIKSSTSSLVVSW
jgi:hypothetical protein